MDAPEFADFKVQKSVSVSFPKFYTPSYMVSVQPACAVTLNSPEPQFSTTDSGGAPRGPSQPPQLITAYGGQTTCAQHQSSAWSAKEKTKQKRTPITYSHKHL